MPQPVPVLQDGLAERAFDGACRPRVFDLADDALVEHQVQYARRPAHGFRPVRIANLFARAQQRVGRERAIRQGRLVDQGDDECDLGKRQFLRRLAEIGAARRLDTVLAAAEVRHVHVFDQQLLPRELALDPQRHDDVADLLQLGRGTARPAAQMLRDLHRERRGAGMTLPEDALGERPQDRHLVDALVREEILVFGGEDGVDEERRDVRCIVDEDTTLGR